MLDLKSNELRICFPEKNLFICRDHNYAFAAWEIARAKGIIKPNASLIHIDNHLDYSDPLIRTEIIIDESNAVEIASQLRIAEFIIPAQKRGTVGKCYVISDDSIDEKNTEIFERAYSYNHYEQVYRRKWYDETEGTSVILDLDLDFFNTNVNDYDRNPFLLPDKIIKSQLTNILKYSWDWNLITVALSPEYCGGDEACLHILAMLLEVLELDISHAKTW